MVVTAAMERIKYSLSTGVVRTAISCESFAPTESLVIPRPFRSMYNHSDKRTERNTVEVTHEDTVMYTTMGY